MQQCALYSGSNPLKCCVSRLFCIGSIVNAWYVTVFLNCQKESWHFTVGMSNYNIQCIKKNVDCWILIQQHVLVVLNRQIPRISISLIKNREILKWHSHTFTNVLSGRHIMIVFTGAQCVLKWYKFPVNPRAIQVSPEAQVRFQSQW